MILVKHVLDSKGRDTWTVRPDTTVLEALGIMSEKNIGAVLVLEGHHLAGVFSERDYARKVILRGKSSRDTPVRDLMTTEVVTISPDDSVHQCMTLMTENRFRHLPVVEEDRVVGIVTIGDVVKRVISDQAETIKSLEQYITQG